MNYILMYVGVYKQVLAYPIVDVMNTNVKMNTATISNMSSMQLPIQTDTSINAKN